MILANNIILIVGEIREIYFKEELLEKDGFINLSESKVASINGLDVYTIPVLKERFGNQRQKK